MNPYQPEGTRLKLGRLSSAEIPIEGSTQGIKISITGARGQQTRRTTVPLSKNPKPRVGGEWLQSIEPPKHPPHRTNSNHLDHHFDETKQAHNKRLCGPHLQTWTTNSRRTSGDETLTTTQWRWWMRCNDGERSSQGVWRRSEEGGGGEWWRRKKEEPHGGLWVDLIREETPCRMPLHLGWKP